MSGCGEAAACFEVFSKGFGLLNPAGFWFTKPYRVPPSQEKTPT